MSDKSGTPSRAGAHSRYLQIADQIRRRIEDGEWSPGTRLPRLDDFATEYDANRDTVGRAVAVLESEGLVWAVQGRGITVRHLPSALFREAWIAGVRRYHPGDPKASYVAPWESMAAWERSSAAAVCEQVRAFVLATAGQTRRLSREQRGRFVAVCWIGQVLKHFPDPKPAYVADWDQLPEWQRETDADIFTRIEHEALDEIPIAVESEEASQPVD